MKITVAICTWNRARSLQRTLEQMEELAIPPGISWELLVVDNNSADGTSRVIDSFLPRLPVRRLFEARAGLSHARNRAIAAATGEYILWTDDDVLVSQRWLAEYVEAIRRCPEATFFGGPIRPLFEEEPPRWLREIWPLVEGDYAIRDLGAEPRRFDGDAYPFGANFAVRCAEQRRFLYDPRRGRKQGGLVSGNETGVLFALMNAGLTGWWVPSAPVWHCIPAERMTVRFLREYHAGQGTLRARLTPDESSPRLLGAPLACWARGLRHEVAAAGHRILGRPDRWIAALREACRAWGEIREYRGAR